MRCWMYSTSSHEKADELIIDDDGSTQYGLGISITQPGLRLVYDSSRSPLACGDLMPCQQT
jgi:hypothetical protein